MPKVGEGQGLLFTQSNAVIQAPQGKRLAPFNELIDAISQSNDTMGTLPQIVIKLQKHESSQKLNNIFSDVFGEAKANIEKRQDLQATKQAVTELLHYDKRTDYQQQYKELLLKIAEDSALLQKTKDIDSAFNTVATAFFSKKEDCVYNKQVGKFLEKFPKDPVRKAQKEKSFEKFSLRAMNELLRGQSTPDNEKRVTFFLHYIKANPACHERLLTAAQYSTPIYNMIHRVVAIDRIADCAVVVLAGRRAEGKDTSLSTETVRERISLQGTVEAAIHVTTYLLASQDERIKYEDKAIGQLTEALANPASVTEKEQQEIQLFLGYALGNRELYKRLHKEAKEKGASKKETAWVKKFIESIARYGLTAVKCAGSIEKINERKLALEPFMTQVGSMMQKEVALDIGTTMRDIAKKIQSLKQHSNNTVQNQLSRIENAFRQFDSLSCTAEHFEQWVVALELEMRQLGVCGNKDKEIDDLIQFFTAQFSPIKAHIQERKQLEDTIADKAQKINLFENMREVGIVIEASHVFKELTMFKKSTDHRPGESTNPLVENGFGLFSQEPFSRLLQTSTKAAEIKNSVEEQIHNYPSYGGAQILFDDSDLYDRAFGKESYTSSKALLRKKFWKDIGQVLTGNIERIFVLKPLLIGTLVHPSMINVQGNMLHQGHVIGSYENVPLSFERVCASRCFVPSIEQLALYPELQKIFPGLSVQEIARQLNYRFAVAMSRLFKNQEQEFQRIQNDAIRQVQSLLPRLPIKEEEQQEIQPRMFCSEFIACVLERVLHMVNEELNQMAQSQGIKATGPFLSSLVNPHQSLKSMHPGKLAKTFKQTKGFTEKTPPLMQLLIKKDCK